MGTQWTDKDYAAAGWRRRTIRLQHKADRALEQVAVRWGCSISAAVGRLALEATKKLAGRGKVR